MLPVIIEENVKMNLWCRKLLKKVVRLGSNVWGWVGEMSFVQMIAQNERSHNEKLYQKIYINAEQTFNCVIKASNNVETLEINK